MTVFDPSTHDDLIAIDINLSTPSAGRASFSTVAIIVADVLPGGGRFAEYASVAEVEADISNLNTTAVQIATVAFGQNKPPEKIIFIGADIIGAETYVEALDAAIAEAADFYGVLIDSRTEADQLAVSLDIESKATSDVYYLFGFQSDDADWLTTAVPAAYSTIEGNERTVCWYHDDNTNDATSDRLDVAHMVDRLAYDADEKAVGWNSKVSSVDALTTSLTQTQKAFARANFANTALPMGTTTTTYVDPGKTLAGRPVDHIVGADWLTARMQEAAADLIVTKGNVGTKITVDAAGQNLMGGTLDGVGQLGVTIGHFLSFQLTNVLITTTDITDQKVRYTGQAQSSTGVRQVGVDVFASTDPIVTA